MSRPGFWSQAAVAFVVALFAFAAPAQANSGCAHADTEATRTNLNEVAGAVLCLVNRERTARGRSALRPSKRLGQAAERHSRDMVVRGYFAHVSPGGLDLVARARRTGYVARTAAWRLAENLGWGSGHFATAAEMVKAWMKSSGHRHNMLRREMEHLGVGNAFGTPNGGDGLTTTLLFGSRS